MGSASNICTLLVCYLTVLSVYLASSAQWDIAGYSASTMSKYLRLPFMWMIQGSRQ